MGERLKLSKFNVSVGAGPDPIIPAGLFNTATGNYVFLSEELAARYTRLVSGESVEAAEAGLLYTAGFAVEHDIDELVAVRYAFELSRKQRTSPHLTIAPTLACNFGCGYCFEQHVRGQMRDDVQDRLIQFVKQIMIEKGDHLSISWFGGEPLMGLPVIRRLAKEFLAMVESGDISTCSSNVITNGFFLKQEVAAELFELGVRSIQITIDGPSRIHDSRRALKGGGETFQRIVENIRQLPEELQVVVRVNVDRENREFVEDLFAELDEVGILRRVVVSAAKVEDFSGKREPPPNLLSSREFAEFEVDLIKKAQSHAWPLYVSTPKPRLTGVCQVDSINSFVVSPTGELLKCWAELGNNGHVVGHLLKPETWKQLRPTRLTERDPFDDAECRACPLLPTCMGCCPLIRQNNREVSRKVCPPFKHNFSRILGFQFGSETRIVNYIRDPS